MSKKIFWKSDTIPPTNYIWAKTDSSGEIVGLYEHVNGTWTLMYTLSSSQGGGTTVTGDYVPLVTDGGQVYATDQNGDQFTIPYSVDPVANTIALRSSNGNLKTGTPVEDDDCVPLSYISWVDV